LAGGWLAGPLAGDAFGAHALAAAFAAAQALDEGHNRGARLDTAAREVKRGNAADVMAAQTLDSYFAGHFSFTRHSVTSDTQHYSNI
jgi:hypothetical protein